MNKFHGIFPALLTPFTKDNRINEKELENLINYNLKKGVSGFYVGGSTAEAFLLSTEERKQLIDIAADVCGKKATIIAHIGAISTDAAIELADYAKSKGADAMSSIPPFYYKFTYPEIKKFYFDIADAVDLPMIVYNFPAFSGVTLTEDNIGEFLNDDRFIGVKHTSNDFYAMERFKNKFPNKVVYNGFDEMFLAGISMGADGGVGSTYNFMAEKFIAITNAVKSGDITKAQSIQKDVNTILKVLLQVGIMSGEKEILNQMGMDFGIARRPFRPLTDEEKKLISDVVMPLL